MTEQTEKAPGMRPIWYFVGWVVGLIGLVILVGGFYNLANPEQMDTELAWLHPDIWWGAFMLICGFVFWYVSKDQTVE